MIRTSGFLPVLTLPLPNGSIAIPIYFLAISAIFISLAFFIRRKADVESMSVRAAMDVYLAIMLGGFLGSRALHVLWEEPRYYWDDPTRVFDIMSGGFVWYGGFLGALLGFFCVHRFNTEVRETTKMAWLDFFTPFTAFGYSAGRFACFLTGCCYGRECPWPEIIGGASVQFPTQLFAVIWEATIGLMIWKRRLAAGRDLRPGQVFWTWLGLHGVGRILMELMRADDRGPSLSFLGVDWTLSMAVSLGFILAWATFGRSAKSFKSFDELSR